MGFDLRDPVTFGQEKCRTICAHCGEIVYEGDNSIGHKKMLKHLEQYHPEKFKRAIEHRRKMRSPVIRARLAKAARQAWKEAERA